MSDDPELDRRGTDTFDLVSIGETMVSFVSSDGGRDYLAVTAGAESNVAVGMARLGCRARWVSRLGDDPLGRLVENLIAGGGVDLAVVRDPDHPTGVMTKHVTGPRRRTQYYRSGSAASRLSVDDLDRAGAATWTHTTGITAALSASAAELVEAIADRHGGRFSFDVNYRPALWPDAATAATTLLPVCRRADVVFVGDDEAEALFGTSDQEALADLIIRRDDQELVLKRGAGPASTITLHESITVPALRQTVVDLTGAGDAFAAGYLAGSCYGWTTTARLRLGHLMAARVVDVLEDVPPEFTANEVEASSPEALAARWNRLDRAEQGNVHRTRSSDR